jgi:hypothetical protein
VIIGDVMAGSGGEVFRWCTALVGGLLAFWGADPGQAQPRAARAVTSEREEFLFILNPPPQPAFNGAVVVLWIPAPLQRYCLEKTREQCVAIDYCARATNRDFAQCRNLPVGVINIPKYSRDMYPRRVLAMTYFRAATAIKGFRNLLEYFDVQPKSDFDRLSMNARIRARIRVNRSADDDNFDLLEVLRVPVL